MLYCQFPFFVILVFVFSNCTNQEADEYYNSGTSDQTLNTEINPPLELKNVPDQVPDGMVYVPGGSTTIGSEEGEVHEGPTFTTKVQPFFMDRHPVTVGQFREFVKETEYVTFSEKIGDGIVFDFENAEWTIIPDVYWEFPLGPDNPKAPANHPVTLLIYEDVEAYLDWVGKRLPTEIEWEHAARGLSDRNDKYAWGDQLTVEGRYMANTWNGVFPESNNQDDGFLTTAPVGQFGKTELGLTDMGGNVWEWTSSWFRSYEDRNETFVPGLESEKALRGGSFMCHISYCHGYRVTARSHTPPSNNMFHIGFRGVKDIDK